MSGLKPPITCLITPGQLTAENYRQSSLALLDSVRRAVDAGVSMLQVREKQLTARHLQHLVDGIVLIAGSRSKVLVNDRLDVALAAGADGVHLTSRSLPVASVRAAVPDGFLISRSVHSHAEADEAHRDGADLVLYSPIFETPGKKAALGTAELRRLCGRVPIPVLALGGVDDRNVLDVLAAGAAGIAAIRAFNNPDSLERLMHKLSAS